MTKKAKKNDKVQTPKQGAKRADSPRAIQREWIQELREEIGYLHELSLSLMAEQGILPPFYGGDFLEEDMETIVLWGELDNNEQEIGLLMLRVAEDVEPNRELRIARDDVDMVNDWPIADFFKQLQSMADAPSIEMGPELDSLLVTMILPGPQVQPAPGYDRKKMLEHMYEDLPYAVFLHIPVIKGETGEDLDYDWGNLESFRAEVVFAETPDELETAVWKYRLELALKYEINDIKSEAINPDDVMMAVDVGGLTGVFDVMVMDAMRYYGSTSPIKARQQTLDVMRGEDGDLVVYAPLKAEVEPVPLLAEAREDFSEAAKDGILLKINSDSDVMKLIWPQVRPHPYFCFRVRHGMMKLGKSGQPRVDGYLPAPVIEWIVAESIPELYAKTLLYCLRQLLVCTGYIRTYILPPELADELDDDATP